MMKSMNGIKRKMMKGIIGPTLTILVIVALVIVLVMESAVSDIRMAEISAESGQAANRISEYFTKYMEVTNQLAANEGLREMLAEVKSGDDITKSAYFDMVRATMTNASNTDPDNILVSWIADVDSSRCVEDADSGYVSELGKWDITSRDWYTKAAEADTTIVTEPYENSSTGEMVASVVTPVHGDNGELLGVAAVDVAIGTLSKMMSEYTLGNSGFFILLTPEGNIMFAEDANLINTAV